MWQTDDLFGVNAGDHLAVKFSCSKLKLRGTSLRIDSSVMVALINRLNGGKLSGKSVVPVTITYTLMWKRLREVLVLMCKTSDYFTRFR